MIGVHRTLLKVAGYIVMPALSLVAALLVTKETDWEKSQRLNYYRANSVRIKISGDAAINTRAIELEALTELVLQFFIVQQNPGRRVRFDVQADISKLEPSRYRVSVAVVTHHSESAIGDVVARTNYEVVGIDPKGIALMVVEALLKAPSSLPSGSPPEEGDEDLDQALLLFSSRSGPTGSPLQGHPVSCFGVDQQKTPVVRATGVSFPADPTRLAPFSEAPPARL